MGIKMVMAAVGYEEEPTNNMRRWAKSRNFQGASVKPKTQSLMAAATPVAVSIQPKILAAATMNMTVAVVSTVSKQIFTNILK